MLVRGLHVVLHDTCADVLYRLAGMAVSPDGDLFHGSHTRLTKTQPDSLNPKPGQAGAGGAASHLRRGWTWSCASGGVAPEPELVGLF